MYCHHCGFEVKENDVFCKKCGTNLHIKNINSANHKLTKVNSETFYNKPRTSLVALKVVGAIFFYGMGIVLLVYSVLFYYALWGIWGVIGTLVLFPLVEIFPIVAWIVTGDFPGLIFALWGIGIIGGVLMGIGSSRD